MQVNCSAPCVQHGNPTSTVKIRSLRLLDLIRQILLIIIMVCRRTPRQLAHFYRSPCAGESGRAVSATLRRNLIAWLIVRDLYFFPQRLGMLGPSSCSLTTKSYCVESRKDTSFPSVSDYILLNLSDEFITHPCFAGVRISVVVDERFLLLQEMKFHSRREENQSTAELKRHFVRSPISHNSHRHESPRYVLRASVGS